MKKTLISIFLVAVMLVSFILPASAEAGTLSANATFAEDKKTFTVDLVVANNPGFIAVTAEAAYDSSVLTLKSAKNGEIFESIFTPSQTLNDNPYKIIWMEATATEDITKNGILASYTFEIKNTAVEQTEIKFSISDSVNANNEGEVAINPCTFKVDLKNNTGKSETASQLPVSSSADTVGTGIKDAVSSKNNILSEVASDEIESKEDAASATITAPSENIEDLDNLEDEPEVNNDRSLVTLLTIAVILVLGGAVAFVAIYFRKKSSAKNEEK